MGGHGMSALIPIPSFPGNLLGFSNKVTAMFVTMLGAFISAATFLNGAYIAEANAATRAPHALSLSLCREVARCSYSTLKLSRSTKG